ncbi:MAG: anthranilate phosphoribosyltransferase [Bacillota bacterium]
MFNKYLEKVIKGNHLEVTEMEEAMNTIMNGEISNSQLAGFLIGLKMKGESIEEITGAARVMREKAIPINKEDIVVDTCGTGGDGSGTFNISTTVALVLAGSELSVAKHGNRSVSSKSGSADVLEALGINLNLSPSQVEKCLNEVGMGFLFAPVFHKAMKHAITPRKELKVRTIFNILGPLTNPARADYQVLGVYHPDLVTPMAEVLKNLGIKSAMVVHGAGGLDEFSLSGKNKVAYLKNGKIKEETVSPEDAGLKRAKLNKIKGGTPQTNSNIILSILKGKKGPKRDIVLFNTAAALIITGKANSWKEGTATASRIIDSGAPLEKLKELIEYTNTLEVVS